MFLQIIYQSAIVITLYMTFGYIIAQIKKDVSIVDIFWGGGFALLALFSLYKNGLFLNRQLIVTILVFIWALRLSGYIVWRKKGEDPRYTQLKKEWGRWSAVYIFFFIFMLQGLLVFIIGLPILLINASNNNSITLLDYIGIGIWTFGISYETIADWQLHTFLKNSANLGSILQSGLWKYSRHPNYFGELLIWIGISIIALNVSYGWIGIISPLTLAYILFFISGPITEKGMEKIKGFQEYMQKTSMIIPWIQKGAQ